MPINYGFSLVNYPLYPFVYRSIFDTENFVSKMYVSTFFERPENTMITAKFGFKWLFFQLN